MRPDTRSTRSARPPADGNFIPSIPTTATKRHRVEAAFQVYKDNVPAPPKKKTRHRITDIQLQQLEALYHCATHPTRQEKENLGKEVGMSARTVTVWFQNRRQLARKASEADIRAGRPENLSGALRKPLASVSAVTNEQMTDTATPNLSSHIALHRRAKFPAPLEELSRTIRRPENRDRDSLSTKEKPDTQDCQQNRQIRALQWACGKEELVRFEDISRVASTNSSEGGDTTDEEGDVINTDDDDPRSETSFKLPRKSISIPPEMSAQFSADVVLGASLLLSFQHSAI